ncbi:MAG: hypothetical protein DHS20C15_14250 [Planctomycetota bacterium]|nr:MAG: hypothetical protein DHS20C15_14250 [Planctomycetota bacterium]
MTTSRPLLTATLLAGATCLGSAPLSAQHVIETREGYMADDTFGDVIANAGDIDADGVDDLIIGSPTHQVDRGRVELISGRTGGSLISFVGAPGDRMGRAVAGLGDVNGDGHSEFAYSSPGSSLVSGFVFYDRVTVYDYGNDTVLHTRWFLSNDGNGASLSGGGDSDGDGLPELLIGAPGYDAPGLGNAGRVWRLRVTATASSLQAVATGTQTGEGMGHAVAWIGDTHGDGIDRFATSSPYRDEFGDVDVGRVYLFDGLGNAEWDFSGPTQDNGRFGWSLAGGGDFSGDGLPDVIIGSPYYTGGGLDDRGRVGVNRGFNADILAFRYGDSANDLLGWDVEPVVFDGATHVLAGAPGDGETGGISFNDPGEVHRLSMPSLATTWSDTGDASWGHLGRAVAALGDMNGDGSEEWAVGQPFPIDAQTNTDGNVYIYGGATHVAAASHFGAGLAGTLGIPSIDALGTPKIPSNSLVRIENSLGLSTPALLFLGFSTAAIPFKGGTVHVNPFKIQSFLMPAPRIDFLVALQDDHTLHGLTAYVQAAMADPAAPLGVALTRGLRLDLGE